VSLALLGEPGIQSVDATLCASKRAMYRLKSLPWWQDSDPHITEKPIEENYYVMVSGG
jgi:hypothetical protein